MSLFWQEHKKLWRSGLTRLAAGGMLLLTLGAAGVGHAVCELRHHAGGRKPPGRRVCEYSQESAICRPVANAHR